MRVSRSAQVLATRRARATAHDQPTGKDPLAHLFSSDEFSQALRGTENEVHWVLNRFQLIDDFYVKNLSSFDQVLALGPGLDTKFHRYNRISSDRFFEVDSPEVHEFKKSRLQECTSEFPTYVSADLADDDSFDELLDRMDSSLPTFVLAEGVFYYLEKEVFSKRLDAILNKWSSNLFLGLDLIEESFFTNPMKKTMREKMKEAGEWLRFGIQREDFESDLKKTGMKIESWNRAEASHRYYGENHFAKDPLNENYVVLASSFESGRF